MATEKFFVFNESGTLKRLKGRIVRFLDNEDPDNDDKVNIRASISVPASAEGLTPANNLSDVSSVATSRDNLGVPSDDEVAEGIGTKLVGPALYFSTNDYIEFADDGKWSFTDSADDLPMTIEGWINMEDATNFVIASKYGTSAAVREWYFFTTATDKLSLLVTDTSGNYESVISDAALTAYEGKPIHVAATFGGAGPNSASAFTGASGEMTLYVNGKAVAATASDSGTYTGMSDTSQALWLGRASSTYAKGHMSDIRVHNRELTAAEVVQAMNGDLGFADEWGGANGGIHNADFTSDSTDSYTANAGTISATATVSSDSNNIQFTCGAGSGNHRLQRSITALTTGKRYRLAIGHYIPSGQSNIDQIQVTFYDGSTLQTVGYLTATDAWTVTFIEFVATKAHSTLFLYGSDGGNSSFTDAGEDDTFAINRSVITEIGTLADLRASNFDESTGKLYCESGQFTGVNNGATLTGRALPVYQTDIWTPSLNFGGAAVGMTYSIQEARYTRTGNVVHVQGMITLTAKGSSTGNATLEGLPFTSKNTSGGHAGLNVSYMTGMASLSTGVAGLVSGNSTSVLLNQFQSTGINALTQANFTDTSSIRFSGTYEIQ